MLFGCGCFMLVCRTQTLLDEKRMIYEEEQFKERMLDEIRGIIQRLTARFERDVPSAGPFGHVYEEYENKDSHWCITHVCLFVIPIDKEVSGHETERALECRVYRLPLPFRAAKVIGRGTNEVLFDKLRDPNLPFEMYEVYKGLNKIFKDEFK